MSVIVFDVNETLLNLQGLDPHFTDAFGERGGEVKRLWFTQLLQTASVVTQIDAWQDFGELGRRCLTAVAKRLSLRISRGQMDAIMAAMRQLEPHDDVVGGLRILGDSGATLVALTNSGQSMAEEQLAHAGIDSCFEHIMSVESVSRFKPDQAVYDHVASSLGAKAGDLTLVATHDWDCAGAMHAGWRAAFVERPGQTFNPVFGKPTFTAEDMITLARTLIDKGVAK